MRLLALLLLVGLFATACGTAVTRPSDADEGGTGLVTRIAYGDDSSQWVDVTLPGPPEDGPYPTVALLHGGFWYEGYGADLMDDLAADVVARGFAVANIEYRRINGGGGFPATFEDVAAALDSLAEAPGVDARRVAVAGHSAGGHLALWASSRDRLPAGAPGADPRLQLCAAVGQAPVADLAAAARMDLGGGATQALLGGELDMVPDRYAIADPMRLVGGDVPIRLVHGERDGIVPSSQSRDYAAAVEAAGGTVEFASFNGGHFDVLDPGATPWTDTMAWIVTTCGFEATA